MKHIIFIFFLPLVAFPQQVLIKHLSNNINTTSAEINFIQTNETTAYLVVRTNKRLELETGNIYTTKYINGEWGKKRIR